MDNEKSKVTKTTDKHLIKKTSRDRQIIRPEKIITTSDDEPPRKKLKFPQQIMKDCNF